jgi:hypothetical protein
MHRDRSTRPQSHPVATTPSPPPRRERRLLYAAALAGGFVASRLLYWSIGVRFDSSSLGWYWQYVDPVLLKYDLVRSLVYLHSQPPLFNLFLGLILKLFPGHEATAFQLIFLALGLTLTLSMFFLMARLGAPFVLAAALTGVFILSPAAILYENHLFYSYPLAALLCAAALCLHRFVAARRARDGLAFFTLLASLVYLRSVFHWVWFVFFVALLSFHLRADRKRILLTAAVPALLVAALYAKNQMIFGTSVTSSWLGMNLSRMTTFRLPREERAAMVQAGQLSQLALAGIFQSVDLYRQHFPWVPSATTGIPVLDQVRKQNGELNLNHLAYLEISRRFARDALQVIRLRPGVYLHCLLRTYFIFFVPASDYGFLSERNRAAIRSWEGSYDAVVNLRFQRHDVYKLEDERARSPLAYYEHNIFNMGWSLLLAYCLVVAYGFRHCRAAFRRAPADLPLVLTGAFLWISIVYVTVLGNALEYGENNRFRFDIDPLIFALLAVALPVLWKRGADALAARR